MDKNAPKKRGRPPKEEGQMQLLPTRFEPSTVKAIDDVLGVTPKAYTRADLIREAVELGLPIIRARYTSTKKESHR